MTNSTWRLVLLAGALVSLTSTTQLGAAGTATTAVYIQNCTDREFAVAVKLRDAQGREKELGFYDFIGGELARIADTADGTFHVYAYSLDQTKGGKEPPGSVIGRGAHEQLKTLPKRKLVLQGDELLDFREHTLPFRRVTIPADTKHFTFSIVE